mmetsp:Transcript_26740/g.39616  ORF Transcript_26740/g.39616 Transcript_26740/m.39616 type:complete len:237 (-) Transcript_26740:56-766(-)
MARAGHSTLCTKVTPAIWCMISGTSLGLVIAVIILPVMCSISLFPITSHAVFIASVAATLTCFLVSHIQAVTSGTISGSAFPSCLGAFSWKTETHCKASSRAGHLISTGSCAKIPGRRDFIAKGVMFLQIAIAVSAAAVFTAGLLDVACPIMVERHCALKASASTAPSATALTVANAARASASSFEPHLAIRPEILDAKPDFSTPSALMVSTTDAASPRVKFASLDSRDMFIPKYM